MPNKFKLNPTGKEANSLFKGNWAIDTSPNNTGGGPSVTTGFYNGVEVPADGWALYHEGSVFITESEADFLGRIAELRGSYPNGINEALTWVNEQEDILVLSNVVNNIVTDGLVLNLDAGALPSFVDNKPTVNLVSNWNLDGGWSKGYQRDIVFNEIAPPEGIDAPTVGFNRGTSSAYWYSYGDYTPQVPGETYTVSIYVKTNDPSFSINFYTANNSETGRFWSSHIGVPNDGKWHRVVWPAFTNASNSQSDSLSFNMRMSGQYGEASENRTWLCAPQFQQGTQVTPFVAGTRSQNSTWYDLSGESNNGTLTNGPTYNSNDGGSIVFDGVDDYISLPSTLDSLNGTAEASLEMWVKLNSASNGVETTGLIQLSNYNNGNGNLYFYSNGYTYLDIFRTSRVSQVIRNSTVDPTQWHMLTVTTTPGTNGWKVYWNDILKYQTTGQSTVSVNSTIQGGFTLGRNNNNRELSGNIASTRIYNRSLAPDEVFQNFNAQKSRFGI